jgi:hypothetical protein
MIGNFEHVMSALEEELGESNFPDAVGSGRSMTIEQALAFGGTP